MNPLDILKDAIKAVPAVRYALGIAGIAAVIAIVAGFQIDYRVAVLGVIIILVLMFGLVVFAWFAEHSTDSAIRPLSLFLAWVAVLLVSATGVCIFTGFFWGKPRPLGFYVGATPTPTPTPRPISEILPKLKNKMEPWIDRVFTAQAPNGGIKETPSARVETTSSWTTAQCLMAVLSAQGNIEKYTPNIKAAFSFIESIRHPAPEEGWNYYGDADTFTVTEISSWVALAYTASIESRTKIWSEDEQKEILNRIDRELNQVVSRQDGSGGWSPIIDKEPRFTRTYSTIMALWCLIEAKRSPIISARIGNTYDDAIYNGINWLLSGRYIAKVGWLQNPNRPGQDSRFDGLTAHALFVLSRAEHLTGFAWIKNNNIYVTAQRDYVGQDDLGNRSISNDNSSIPDADQRIPVRSMTFKAEGSTFLWFPWTFVELANLSTGRSVPPDIQKVANQRFSEILDSNYNRLDSYVESNDYMYMLGENLYCISTGLKQLPPG
jgi:hypothetical protein